MMDYVKKNKAPGYTDVVVFSSHDVNVNSSRDQGTSLTYVCPSKLVKMANFSFLRVTFFSFSVAFMLSSGCQLGNYLVCRS